MRWGTSVVLALLLLLILAAALAQFVFRLGG
jgi:hypothetical protein